MDEQTLYSKFHTNEAKTTRKVLGRIPEDSDYRPDPRSRTAKEIAWQIICEERMIIDALETGKVEWAPPPMPATMAGIVAEYDELMSDLHGRWSELPEERWNGALDFFGDERPASAWRGVFCSTSSITAARSLPTSGRWVRQSRRSMGPVGMNPDAASAEGRQRLQMTMLPQPLSPCWNWGGTGSK